MSLQPILFSDVSPPQHEIFVIKSTSFDITVIEVTDSSFVVQIVISNRGFCIKHATRNILLSN